MQFLIGDCFWVTGARLDRYMCLVLVGSPRTSSSHRAPRPRRLLSLAFTRRRSQHAQQKVIMLADSSPNPDEDVIEVH